MIFSIKFFFGVNLGLVLGRFFLYFLNWDFLFLMLFEDDVLLLLINGILIGFGWWGIWFKIFSIKLCLEVDLRFGWDDVFWNFLNWVGFFLLLLRYGMLLGLSSLLCL